MHRPTIEVYEQIGGDYVVLRGVQDPERATGVADAVRPGGRILDLGCGPGHHLPLLGPDAVGLDAAHAMVHAARTTDPSAPLVRGDLTALPFDRAAFAAVWASKAHQHLAAADLPLALAELHRVIEPDGRLELTMFTTSGAEASDHGVAESITAPDSGDDLPGRWFTFWDPDRLAEVIGRAGFVVERSHRSGPFRDGIARLEITARRDLMLPDFVGAGMQLLCCGINPSVHAAEAGVGYVTRSNRFWPALVRAGLCDVERDPRRLLRDHRVGMTDLVMRATPRASDIERDEFRHGFAGLERLCGWLRPRALVVVSIGAWRDAVGDRRAQLGWQPQTVGPTPVYVMPSTSGLNARVGMAELADHLRTAAAGPPSP